MQVLPITSQSSVNRGVVFTNTSVILPQIAKKEAPQISEIPRVIKKIASSARNLFKKLAKNENLSKVSNEASASAQPKASSKVNIHNFSEHKAALENSGEKFKLEPFKDRPELIIKGEKSTKRYVYNQDGSLKFVAEYDVKTGKMNHLTKYKNGEIIEEKHTA